MLQSMHLPNRPSIAMVSHPYPLVRHHLGRTFPHIPLRCRHCPRTTHSITRTINLRMVLTHPKLLTPPPILPPAASRRPTLPTLHRYPISTMHGRATRRPLGICQRAKAILRWDLMRRCIRRFPPRLPNRASSLISGLCLPAG